MTLKPGPEIRISLGLEDFICLIRGGELSVRDEQGTVKLILQDIGWTIMEQEIASAVHAPHYEARMRGNRN